MIRGAALALGLAAVLAAGCSEERRHGHYIHPGALRPGATPEERWSFAAGAGFVLWLGHTRRPRITFVSESTEQLDLWIELPGRPKDGDPVDLSSARARYEQGGQALSWISETATGTLVIETQGSVLSATIDATFASPLLGDGERSYRASQTLDRRAP